MKIIFYDPLLNKIGDKKMFSEKFNELNDAYSDKRSEEKNERLV